MNRIRRAGAMSRIRMLRGRQKTLIPWVILHNRGFKHDTIQNIDFHTYMARHSALRAAMESQYRGRISRRFSRAYIAGADISFQVQHDDEYAAIL